MRKGIVVLGMLVGAFLTTPGLESRARATEFTTPTQTLTIPLTQTDWGPTSTSLAGLNPMQFQQFNASLYNQGDQTAVLLGVELALDYQFNNTISMRFDNVSTITVNATGNMRLTMPNSPTNIVSPLPTFTNSASLTSTSADIFSKFVPLPTKVITGTSAASYGVSDTATLAQFTGTSTIGLPVYASAQSAFTTTSGNGFGSSVTLARATARLFYRYTLVPEPSSMALVGIGLMGFLMVGRNRARIRATESR